MGDGRQSDFGETVLVRNVKRCAGWECDGAFAPREHDEPLDECRAKEPARECEPGEGGERPLYDAGEGLGVSWAGEPEEEKGEGGPAPGAFDEPDVEDVGFVGKVVGFVEGVGEVGEEGVGGVEVGVVLDGVDGADEEDEGEGYKSCLSGIDTDSHHSRCDPVLQKVVQIYYVTTAYQAYKYPAVLKHESRHDGRDICHVH